MFDEDRRSRTGSGERRFTSAVFGFSFSVGTTYSSLLSVLLLDRSSETEEEGFGVLGPGID